MPTPPPCAPQRSNPTPAYIRSLVDRAGYTIAETSLLLGVSTATLERYLNPKATARGQVPPYALQYALEALAAHPRPDHTQRRRRRTEPRP